MNIAPRLQPAYKKTSLDDFIEVALEYDSHPETETFIRQFAEMTANPERQHGYLVGMADFQADYVKTKRNVNGPGIHYAPKTPLWRRILGRHTHTLTFGQEPELASDITAPGRLLEEANGDFHDLLHFYKGGEGLYRPGAIVHAHTLDVSVEDFNAIRRAGYAENKLGGGSSAAALFATFSRGIGMYARDANRFKDQEPYFIAFAGNKKGSLGVRGFVVRAETSEPAPEGGERHHVIQPMPNDVIPIGTPYHTQERVPALLYAA